MTIDFKFSFMQSVKIKLLEGMPGRVVRVSANTDAIEYDVRYFQKSEEKVCRFFEDELTPL